mmetsp:Transcript_21928/g.55829  ORF Transcript_21928/g.55829 Transcript_21928/m.55829 type:complete len:157 (+) Transcript_21928:82-552(+)
MKGPANGFGWQDEAAAIRQARKENLELRLEARRRAKEEAESLKKPQVEVGRGRRDKTPKVPPPMVEFFRLESRELKKPAPPPEATDKAVHLFLYGEEEPLELAPQAPSAEPSTFLPFRLREAKLLGAGAAFDHDPIFHSINGLDQNGSAISTLFRQ